ncbi:MAG: flippase [Candidatus Latescibacteria bacterium]|nr:flippase [Candidatus Latescibacterota bacterium]
MRLRSLLPTRVGVNVAFKLVSEVAGKLLTLVLIAVVARGLGKVGLGVYVYGFTGGLILAQVCDFGMQVFVTREVAGDRPHIARLVGNLLLARGAFACVGLACLIAGVRFAGFDRAGQISVCVLAAGVLLNSFGEFIFYIFRGRQEVQFEAGLSLAHRLLSLVLGLAAIRLGWGVTGVAAGFLVAGAASVGAAYLILIRRFFRPDFTFDGALIRATLREVLPIGIAITLSALCFRADVMLMKPLRGIEELALYGAGRRLMEPWALLPAALMAGVFPAFSGLPTGDPRRSALVRRTVLLLLAVGAPLALLAALFRGEIMALVYGPGYAAAAPPFAVLMVALVPMFLNYGLTHFLIALRLTRLNALFCGVCLLVNVTANLFLIPPLGATGAAFALLVTEGLLTVLCAGAIISHRLQSQSAPEYTVDA